MIAIVDDDHSVRRGFERLLRAAGHAVTMYASAADFFRALPSARPQHVIVDLHMPQIDGFELLDLLEKQYPEIAAIVVTAHADEENTERALRLGALACLRKPVDEPVLLALIGAAPER